jgi:putative ABC transport system permease protein
MIGSFIRIAVRNFARHRMYSCINVGGLALGLACTILIFLWVRDEVNFDRFHRNAGSLYRLNWDFKWNGQEGVGPGTPPPLAAALARDIPEVAAATRIYPVPRQVVRFNDKFFNESGILAADSNFFALFDFTMTSGNPERALAGPNSVVLTEETAHKYFGEDNPLGKFLTIGEDRELMGRFYRSLFKVTGIVKAPPHNSQIQFAMITSISSHPEVAFFDWSWVWMQVVTYATLREGAVPGAVEAKIPPLVRRYAPAAFSRIGFSYDELIKEGGHWDFRLQPFTDVYLGSEAIGNRLGPTGDREQVYLFSLIALFILGIACINFMNLATARSANRAKEIGVRKVLGSSQGRLLGQFLAESLVFSFAALPIALFLVEISLAPFNRISGKSLEFNMMHPAWLPWALLLLTGVVGLVSGSYPAFYLSSFMPLQVMKGTGETSRGGRKLRNILVVFQFAITIALLACAMLVKNQMDFLRQADMGFDKDGIIVISNDNNRLGNQAGAFRDALKSHPEVVDASLSTGVPPNPGFQDYYKAEGRYDEQLALASYMTDDNFLSTLGVSLIQGRGFSKEFRDSSSVILNESAARFFGFKNPIGKTITYPSRGKYTVVGVVKDFHFATLYSPITPFALFHLSSKSYSLPSSNVIVRASAGDQARTITVLESEWKAFAPATPFEYAFLNDDLAGGYAGAERLGTVFLVFSCLTIVIACIGLFGLAAFSTERRTREIGIRKVLGASVGQVVASLSRDFILLVAAANLIAWPVAWYVMDRWLENFAYRTGISWPTFLLAGAIALSVALLTVSYQAIRAALANPVEALRYE